MIYPSCDIRKGGGMIDAGGGDAACAYIGEGCGQACGARRQPGSSYCAAHHALCRLAPGSLAEARRLRELDALADMAGGRQGRPEPEPPDRFLRRLERAARVLARL